MNAIVSAFKSLLAVAATGLAFTVQADLMIPGADGTDGAYAPTANQTIDLSQAPTAPWDSVGAGKGVYDSAQWAVVFKFSSVNIPTAVTVKFANHPSRAPVVWLVNGNVTINGTLDLSGENGKATGHTEPGPGGFRGGTGFIDSGSVGSGGFGIGGAMVSANYNTGGQLWERSGSYATAGYRNEFPLYGNARILPLIGGSGGGGFWNYAEGAGAGGGAILIAATGTITVNGNILANGGGAYGSAGSGSGGAIRLVADALTGSGTMQASGPRTANSVDGGGEGRIRLETLAVSGTIRPSPATDIVAPDDPVILWPPATVPSARVVSVQTVSVPADPHARFELGQADVSLPNLTTAQVLVETRNIAPTGTVRVRVSPKHFQPAFFNATFSNGNATQATWTATATMPQGYSAIQAFAENPAP